MTGLERVELALTLGTAVDNNTTAIDNLSA